MLTETSPTAAATPCGRCSAEAGLLLGELAADGFVSSVRRPVALATGGPGTVFLCHPFPVHGAQPHLGRIPRLLAQPPLMPREPWGLDRADVADTPVARAVRPAPG